MHFIPHLHCYLGNPYLVSIYVFTDLMIGIAYLSIPLSLFSLRSRVSNLGVFRFPYLAFSCFIFFCGVGHFIDILNIWFSWYWFDAIENSFTAIASIYVVFTLPALALEISKVVSQRKTLAEWAEGLEKGDSPEEASQVRKIINGDYWKSLIDGTQSDG